MRCVFCTMESQRNGLGGKSDDQHASQSSQENSRWTTKWWWGKIIASGKHACKSLRWKVLSTRRAYITLRLRRLHSHRRRRPVVVRMDGSGIVGGESGVRVAESLVSKIKIAITAVAWSCFFGGGEKKKKRP